MEKIRRYRYFTGKYSIYFESNNLSFITTKNEELVLWTYGFCNIKRFW